jgi:AraC-like DNA-binding protein
MGFPGVRKIDQALVPGWPQTGGVGISQDRFAAFVDLVAVHLDDHDARGADLAARMYLSRFHFDRIVSSVCGETPARFRRRVLLERSAYRLLTSGHSVLDVAVEAGYSSQEAFTRAFRGPMACPPPRGGHPRAASSSAPRTGCTFIRRAACGCRPERR